MPIGTRVMLSTPPAMTTSWVPLITACAANWIACWDEPHWRSMVTAGTLSGRLLAASTQLRPTWNDCCPACMTQPMMTSSTRRAVQSGALDQRVEHVRAHVHRVRARQPAAALAARPAGPRPRYMRLP